LKTNLLGLPAIVSLNLVAPAVADPEEFPWFPLWKIN
jgi:hypothetical protein